LDFVAREKELYSLGAERRRRGVLSFCGPIFFWHLFLAELVTLSHEGFCGKETFFASA
jgi:hypothetical protein